MKMGFTRLSTNNVINLYGNIRNRCNTTNSPNYQYYGKRGIKVEESFNTFYKFFNWAINNGLEIDRIDNKGNYSISNCQWITKTQNILKQDLINLTVEDVIFIRSADFDYNTMRSNYTCSDYTINNIINYKTFKNIIYTYPS